MMSAHAAAVGADATAVRLRSITKRFPGVVALDDVSVEVAAGSFHALCGENGAGKSTLGKILAGIYTPDAGDISLFGTPVTLSRPEAALAAGVGIVHQELSFAENLTVAENLCLPALPARAGFLHRPEMRRQAERMLASVGAPFGPDRIVGELTTGEQQMLQIAGAVGRGARVIIFDEPTSSLSQHETQRLFELVDRLKGQGVTGIYVSHRMAEIFRLCDTVTVLRDGRHVGTRPARDLNADGLVEMMIGRQLGERPPPPTPARSRRLLTVTGLSSPGRFSDVSLSLDAGEVLGLGGLVGAGRSEVAQAIFGLDPTATGAIEVLGVPVRIRSPRDALRAGIGMVPEDRKRQGLVLSMTALANMTLAVLPSLARATLVRRKLERDLGQRSFDALDVRASSLDAQAGGLSGGNQQKLVLAKWLAARCQVLILDEPTRGIDVAAKAQIHALVADLAARGTGILLISSDLPELLHLSTRIVVLRAGRVCGELGREAANEDRVMRLMAGVA